MFIEVRGLRLVSSLALFALLVSCGGGGDAGVQVPAAAGKRVVYITDSADAPGQFEVYAADTASTTQQVALISSGISSDERPMTAIVSPDGRFIGAIVTAGTGCPSRLELVDTTDERRVNVLGPRDCVDAAAFNSTSSTLAMHFSTHDAAGVHFGLMATSNMNALNTFTGSIAGGGDNAGSFIFSADGQVAVWSEAGGLFRTDTINGGSVASQRTTDRPSFWAVTPDGATAVYTTDGLRFQMTELRPNAWLYELYLTAAVPLGDSIAPGGFRFTLSPDGRYLLYVAVRSGQWQLWLVPLAGPGNELRVDAAAPLASNFWPDVKFAFSSDGSRFSWIGDVGGGDLRVMTATVAAPTTSTILTPASEEPGWLMAWTTPDVVAYHALDTATGVYGLRSVSATAPLTTVALSPTNVPAYGVADLKVCGDGTLVYSMVDNHLGGPTLQSSALFSARAMDSNSVRQITPTIVAPAFGLQDFVCQ